MAWSRSRVCRTCCTTSAATASNTTWRPIFRKWRRWSTRPPRAIWAGKYTGTRTDMSLVAGVDFGTLSVRVSIFDHQQGRLGSATADYPLLRKREDPDHASQSHRDHMNALVSATRKALSAAAIRGKDIQAIALDTTGS